MNLKLNSDLFIQYKSESQKIRIMTETWVEKEIFCPNCGSNLNKFPNNNPAADFYCKNCNEEFELKSKKGELGNRIPDGAYETMMSKINNEKKPNFYFLTYQSIKHDYEVQNFFIIPKHFFVPQMIEKRNPLTVQAKRSGWIGCNILLMNIPMSGKIYYIKNKKIESREIIIDRWKKVLFLQKEKIEIKSWIFDIMICIDKIGKDIFTLNEMYQFEVFLAKRHPDNKHIKEKIRQQLQFLRDMNYLEFIDRGIYKLR